MNTKFKIEKGLTSFLPFENFTNHIMEVLFKMTILRIKSILVNQNEKSQIKDIMMKITQMLRDKSVI